MPGNPIARVLGVAGVGRTCRPCWNSTLASVIMAYCRIVGVPVTVSLRDEIEGLRAIREVDIIRSHVID